MSSLADVFRVLDTMLREGIIDAYALGGATAVLFYAEPTRTYDVDVFVIAPDEGHPLAPLSRVYEWASRAGFSTMGEHLAIHGVPVQFLPAHTPLVREAIEHARTLGYDDVPVRVVDPDYLAALALQAGGARRRERAWQLLEAGAINRERLRELLNRHQIDARVPDDV